MQINFDSAKPAAASAAPALDRQLEQAFLAEMLKYAGPKPSEGAFSGGIGEEQFASFLTESYAENLTESLDLGLFEKLKGIAA